MKEVGIVLGVVACILGMAYLIWLERAHAAFIDGCKQEISEARCEDKWRKGEVP